MSDRGWWLAVAGVCAVAALAFASDEISEAAPPPGGTVVMSEVRGGTITFVYGGTRFDCRDVHGTGRYACDKTAINYARGR